MNISKEDYAKAIKLLDQIIEKAEQEDARFMLETLAANKASHTAGESWIVFHAKTLRSFLSQNVHP